METSALVAMLLKEPDAGELLAKVHAAEKPVTSVVNAFEATLSAGRVLRSYKEASQMVPEMLTTLGIEMAGIGPEAFPDVVDAYLRYGKGTGHPAKLNLGDCFSYATAKRLGVPLLYKGSDFSQTDLA